MQYILPEHSLSLQRQQVAGLFYFSLLMHYFLPCVLQPLQPGDKSLIQENHKLAFFSFFKYNLLSLVTGHLASVFPL